MACCAYCPLYEGGKVIKDLNFILTRFSNVPLQHDAGG